MGHWGYSWGCSWGHSWGYFGSSGATPGTTLGFPEMLARTARTSFALIAASGAERLSKRTCVHVFAKEPLKTGAGNMVA